MVAVFFMFCLLYKQATVYKFRWGPRN